MGNKSKKCRPQPAVQFQSKWEISPKIKALIKASDLTNNDVRERSMQVVEDSMMSSIRHAMQGTCIDDLPINPNRFRCQARSIESAMLSDKTKDNFFLGLIVASHMAADYLEQKWQELRNSCAGSEEDEDDYDVD